MYYAHTLALHSLVRWAVVILGIIAIVRALGGLTRRRTWTSTDARVGLGFTIALDLQFVLGVLLFLVLSPATRLAFQDPGLAVRTHALRFWSFEHPLLMIGAIVLAHIARVRIQREAESRRRHRAGALFNGLALFLVLAGMPWPFLPWGRPFLPFL